jgi:hypothetical protein
MIWEVVGDEVGRVTSRLYRSMEALSFTLIDMRSPWRVFLVLVFAFFSPRPAWT